MSGELLQRIDWAYFPKPYDEELPHYVSLAYERLTPEGVELLDELVAVNASNQSIPVAGDRPPRPQWEGQGEERLLERLEALPEWDRDALVALTQHFKRAFEAVLDRARGQMDLMQQILGLQAKAVAIDPNYPQDAPVKKPWSSCASVACRSASLTRCSRCWWRSRPKAGERGGGE